MKRILVGVAGLLFALTAFAQTTNLGPTVWGKKDGNNYNENLPMASGAGAGVVVATTKAVNDAVAAYLPLSGGTLTGALTGTTLNAAYGNFSGGVTAADVATTTLEASKATIQQASPSLVPPVKINATGNTSIGATIELDGPGALPAKILQVNNGLFSILANDNTTRLLSVDDTGNTSITGTITNLGDIKTQGNLNAQGAVSSTQNMLPASVTNSGVSLTASPNVADVLFYNSPYSVNNRIAEHIWFGNCLQSRFKNDSQAGAVVPLSLCGGYGTGITGITSNSGSGAWTHTGPLTVTGAISGPGSGLTGTGASFTAGSAANIAGGAANQLAYQSASGSTAFAAAPSVAATLLSWNGSGFSWVATPPTPLSGTSGSIGGGLLAAGACTTGTVSVSGATTAMAVVATPVTYPGAGSTWAAYVSAPGVVTVTVCSVVLSTPTASAYNVRVLQ